MHLKGKMFAVNQLSTLLKRSTHRLIAPIIWLNWSSCSVDVSRTRTMSLGQRLRLQSAYKLCA